MYKIFGILMLTVFGVSAAQMATPVVTQSPPSSGSSVSVEAKHHKPHRWHGHGKNGKKRVKNSEQFEAERKARLDRLEEYRAAVEALKSKVSNEEQGWFDLHLKCVKKWIEALKEYKSTDTSLARSSQFGAKELNLARALAALKPTPHHSTKVNYPEKDIEKLEARLKEVKSHVSQLTGDNQVAFQAMIDCAEAYLEALKAAKGQQVNVHTLLVQAMRYVNTMEMFVHWRAHH
jgi:hypothetical protein